MNDLATKTLSNSTVSGDLDGWEHTLVRAMMRVVAENGGQHRIRVVNVMTDDHISPQVMRCEDAASRDDMVAARHESRPWT